MPAILPIAMGVAGFGAAKLGSKGPKTPLSAPAPTTAAATTTPAALPTPPPSTAQNASTGNVAGLQAAARQRKRAAAGLGQLGQPSPLGAPFATPLLQPRSLLGA